MRADLVPLTNEVTRIKDVAASATALINGFGELQQAAIDKALENGATAEELKPLTDLQDDLKTASDDLSAAVANTTGK